MGIGNPFAQPTTQIGGMAPRARPFTEHRLAMMYCDCCFDQHFIRHDIDYSIEAALAMGRWEETHGYHSTYYLMEDNPFYSNDDACFALRELSLMGHECGLHVDARTYALDDFGTDRLGGIKVSFHCPTDEVLWKDFIPFHSAYASKWKGWYVSDSNGSFRDGDPEDDIRFAPGPQSRRMQINLHPEWWFEPDWWKRVSRNDWNRFFYGAPMPGDRTP